LTVRRITTGDRISEWFLRNRAQSVFWASSVIEIVAASAADSPDSSVFSAQSIWIAGETGITGPPASHVCLISPV
jgi:hypothetical protein